MSFAFLSRASTGWASVQKALDQRISKAAIILAATVAVVLALNFAVAPLATRLIDEWSRRDVELRSTLVFNSLRLSLESLLAVNAGNAINELFDQVALDERVLAVAFCDRDGRLLFRSRLIPEALSCAVIAGENTSESSQVAPSFTVLDGDQRPILVGSYPFSAHGVTGNLVVLHDLAFAGRRSAQARRYLAVLLIGIGFLGTGAAVIAVLWIRSLWRSRLKRTFDELREGVDMNPETLETAPLGKELYRLIRDLDARKESLDSDNLSWSAGTLKNIIHDNLANTQIIAVSNREPYIHNRTGDRIEIQQPASGLVSALEPVMRACGGTWIAHGSGSADRETVDAGDHVRVPPDDPRYVLRRMWLNEMEQRGYYYGLANEGLWPLCHIAYVRPVFREGDWQQYRRVNEQFAQAVRDEASRPDPIILVQDYHFALLPRLVRDLLPDATIITFWHIPWPNSETFGICPWRVEILEGLLGSTILGFHTRFHCNNFIDTVDRFLESRIDRELASITLGGHETFIRPYPIAIEWPPAGMKNQLPIEEARAAVRARYGLPADMHIAIGVERFDYTKGILDRMHAVDSFLSNYPQWVGKFVLLQIAAPTRSELATYLQLQSEARDLAGAINDRYQREDWKPILLIAEHHEARQVFELFRAADICIVSSLHDGMNLVAKEFVAARDDEGGVLILSSFAGASRELSEAILVNPYDPHSMGDALYRALAMPRSEQRQRMRVMREHIRTRNVYRWAGKMLLDAEQLRKKQRILQLAAVNAATN
jgi:trehalose 6-phosphate synthase